MEIVGILFLYFECVVIFVLIFCTDMNKNGKTGKRRFEEGLLVAAFAALLFSSSEGHFSHLQIVAGCLFRPLLIITNNMHFQIPLKNPLKKIPLKKSPLKTFLDC